MYGQSLEFASATLMEDREVVLAAVQQDPEALDFASRALRDDPEIQQASRRKMGR